jgi:hypothetical protein
MARSLEILTDLINSLGLASCVGRLDQSEALTMTQPEIIGELLNVKVLINRDDRTVILGTEPPIKFSIDHPYIQGTKLEKGARAALDADAELTGSDK